MKIRTAIIGCGDVVQSYGNNSESTLNHLAALEQNKNYEIIGISDTDESKLKSARERSVSYTHLTLPTILLV